MTSLARALRIKGGQVECTVFMEDGSLSNELVKYLQRPGSNASPRTDPFG